MTHYSLVGFNKQIVNVKEIGAAASSPRPTRLRVKSWRLLTLSRERVPKLPFPTAPRPP